MYRIYLDWKLGKMSEFTRLNTSTKSITNLSVELKVVYLNSANGLPILF